MTRAAALLLVLVACGDRLGGASDPFGAAPTVVVGVTVELREDVPTFKVDGRLSVTFERLDPFIGETPIATGVLPAGSRDARFEVVMPLAVGRLRLREQTSNDRVPFLCGQTEVDARTETEVRVPLDLCLPEA